MIRSIARKIRRYLISPVLELKEEKESAVGQKSLMMLYKYAQHSNTLPMSFTDVGFRVHSQHEEDGIILYIFSLIGTTNKRCVEICAGDGIECNTANLIINHRWIGLLCDGNEVNINKAKNYYATNLDTRYWPPSIVKEWVTKDNINDIIKNNGFTDDIDLLSLDIDGNDYWLWKEISTVLPRVVVLEFNHLWGPDVSVSIPYSENFVCEFTEYGSDYAGASLSAFIKLGKKKGYRLVGTNEIATNAFFVRNDISCDWLPELDASSCFSHPRAIFGMEHRLPAVRNKKWVEV